MTHDEIKNELHRLFKNERENDVHILRTINAAYDTRAWAVFGYPNLFKWLIGEFGLSNGSAGRRITAAKMMRDVPAVEEKLEQGTLNLSAVVQTQAKINAQEKATGTKVSADTKAEAISQVEEKTCEQAEAALFNFFPEAAPEPTKPRPTKMKNKKTRMPLDWTDEQLAELKRLKKVLSHSFPLGDSMDVICYAIQYILKRKDPLRKTATELRRAKAKIAVSLTSQTVASTNVAATKPSHIRIAKADGQQDTGFNLADMESARSDKASKAQTRRDVMRSPAGGCVFVGKTGHVCNERCLMQTDHVDPLGRGGADARENMRPLCRTHNVYEAEQVYGKKHMDQFRRQS